MTKKLLGFALALVFALSLAGSVLADDIRGRISKVENGGRTITVKSRDGKEATVNISSRSTKMNGFSDRAELKEGSSVTVTYEGDRASEVTLRK